MGSFCTPAEQSDATSAAEKGPASSERGRPPLAEGKHRQTRSEQPSRSREDGGAAPHLHSC